MNEREPAAHVQEVMECAGRDHETRRHRKSGNRHPAQARALAAGDGRGFGRQVAEREQHVRRGFRQDPTLRSTDALTSLMACVAVRVPTRGMPNSRDTTADAKALRRIVTNRRFCEEQPPTRLVILQTSLTLFHLIELFGRLDDAAALVHAASAQPFRSRRLR